MAYNPKFSLYHANSRGTGSKLTMSLHPLIDTEDRHEDGYIEMTIANQKTIGIGGNFPTFDDDDSVTVHLTFDDICKMLQVFRGECESINDGKGIYLQKQDGFCCVNLKHIIEPKWCYVLEIWFADTGYTKATDHRFVFSNAEALGICEALANSCGMLVFGVPVVISHN